MTNTTSPASVRPTPAFYLLIFTMLSMATVVVAYNMDKPFIYLGGLFFTLVGAIFTADVAMRHRA